MEQYLCNCGAAGTYKCTLCSPKSILCRDCIPLHLSRYIEDSIIPIHSISYKNGLDTCAICQNHPGIYLQVLEDQANPICKRCKKCIGSIDNSIFIPIKWKELVNNSKDILEIYKRNHIQKLVDNEINNSISLNDIKTKVTEIRDNIIASVMNYAQEKFLEIDTAFKNSAENAIKLKKEVSLQITKKNPDINTLGGKLVSSHLGGAPCHLPSESISLLPIKETTQIIGEIFNKMQIKAKSSKHNLYFFNPGKPTVIKIDVEKMKKEEFIFERNWTFEASWCELECGDLFFCGGNGISNSEVLIVDINKKAIFEKKSFAGRSGHAIIEINDFIYVFGGNRGNYAEKYSFGLDEWTSLADVPYRIPKISICRIPEGVFITGIDCANIYEYNIETNTYKDALSPFITIKNKILFTHENIIYCMCGDKLYMSGDRIKWTTVDISDRDWWSYSKPIVYKKNVYFIKYFVRNLWKLNLETFALEEHYLQEIDNI